MDSVKVDARAKGELKKFVLDNSKAKKILYWNPTTDFRRGVSKEMEWVRRKVSRWNVKPRV